jgi:hypothetical protein
VLAPATLAALPSTPAIETRLLPSSLAATHRGFAFYVAFPKRSIPSLTRSSPCRFTFYVADPISSIQFFAADAAATTAIQLMHRKRLMIGKFPDDARLRADNAMASALITCHDE